LVESKNEEVVRPRVVEFGRVRGSRAWIESGTQAFSLTFFSGDYSMYLDATDSISAASATPDAEMRWSVVSAILRSLSDKNM